MKISLASASNDLGLKAIKVYLPSDLGNGCRVEVCEQVSLASDLSTRASPYLKGSFIPHGPWRDLSSEESSILFCDDPTVQDVKMGLMHVPCDLPDFLENRLQLGNLEDATAIVETSSLAFGSLLRSIETLASPLEPLVIHGPKVDEPGQETVTVNPKHNAYIGLHLDSWDGSSDDDRKKSRTRICVNLGPDLRSYIFVPFTLDSLASALASRQTGRFVEHHSVHRNLFETTLHVPVLRLTMGPRFAYFADTDRMIHDGSSALATKRSVHYTVRGRFQRLKFD